MLRTAWQVLRHPCSYFDRAFCAEETIPGLEGAELYSWRAVRRQNLDELQKRLRGVMRNLALAGALGPGVHMLNAKSNQYIKYDKYGVRLLC